MLCHARAMRSLEAASSDEVNESANGWVTGSQPGPVPGSSHLGSAPGRGVVVLARRRFTLVSCFPPHVFPLEKLSVPPCADDRMRGVRAKIADVLCLSQSERVTPREQSATLIASALAIASTDSMKLKVLLFAAAKDAAGTPELELELADADSTGISVVVSALQKQYPQLERILPRCALAINGEYVTEDAAPALKAGDEVAVLPPMSGG